LALVPSWGTAVERFRHCTALRIVVLAFLLALRQSAPSPRETENNNNTTHTERATKQQQQGYSDTANKGASEFGRREPWKTNEEQSAVGNGSIKRAKEKKRKEKEI
jgi:hypothetical protein